MTEATPLFDRQEQLLRRINRLEPGSAELGEVMAELRDIDGSPLADLLDDLLSILRRYVIFASLHQAHAVTLWIVHTHVINQFDQTPYLWISSAEKQSGKSRLLDVCEILVDKSWRAVLPTEAVVFRKIERDQPSLLLDEVDTIYRKNAGGEHEGLRALLNAGNRKGATVPRCVGQSFELKDFSVYCAKALAGIGGLPDTVADRAIPIRLARRAPSEKVAKFRQQQAGEEAEPIREKLEAWAGEVDLSGARPEVPDALDDRAADGWEPLFAIADAAGAAWPQRARDAAETLQGDKEAAEASSGVRLLADIQAGSGKLGSKEAVFTADLLEYLNALEESPWGDWHGHELGARWLARLLKPYGIRPAGTVRIEGRTAKGYYWRSFEDAWQRYLPSSSETAPKTSQRHNAADPRGYTDPGPPPDPSYPSHPLQRDAPSQEKPNDSARCDVVTDSRPSAEEGEREQLDRPDIEEGVL